MCIILRWNTLNECSKSKENKWKCSVFSRFHWSYQANNDARVGMKIMESHECEFFRKIRIAIWKCLGMKFLGCEKFSEKKIFGWMQPKAVKASTFTFINIKLVWLKFWWKARNYFIWSIFLHVINFSKLISFISPPQSSIWKHNFTAATATKCMNL